MGRISSAASSAVRSPSARTRSTSVRDALDAAADRLASAGVDTPRVDAELLLADVLGVSRTQLQLERARRLAPAEAGRFEELVERRARREPLAYILGEWGFRRLTLKVDGRVLVPRPETEVVVERALALIRSIDTPRVLDLGTGSGAIALAIADEHPTAKVTAVDTSLDALDVAAENAERLGLPVTFRRDGFETAAEGWDLVVSNPPYVAPGEHAALPPEVRDWEPLEALVGEGVHETVARLAKTTWLVLEVADGQARDVADQLRALRYEDVAVTRDLTERERVVEGRRADHRA